MDGVPTSEFIIIFLNHPRSKLFFCSVFDYNYILFWNSLWTVAPVIGIGLFDRFLGESGRSLLNILSLTWCRKKMPMS